jgi:hypothetical protein
MAGTKRWELRESEIYTLCVSQLGGPALVDRALAAILDGLSLNPYGFYPVWDRIRIAKTRLLMIGPQLIPALSLRYRISPPDTVDLLHLEITPPEEMEISDDFPWK